MKQITPYSKDLSLYLCKSEIIDYDHPAVTKVANEIAERSKDKLDYIRNAYEFVRDHISHSADANKDLITCRASEVLQAGHGICFAKSHLLAALLRYKSIPVGMCYQKLILDDETAPILVFHGLNGVYLEEEKKWIRLDPRGNKLGVDAQFSTDKEQLAFPVREEKGEEDLLIVFPEPDKEVLGVMTRNQTRSQLWDDLPVKLAYPYK